MAVEPTSLYELQNKVSVLLAARLGGQVQDIKLCCRDSELVLQGRCRSYYAKQIAQQVVMEAIPNQPSLINEIDIL